MKIVPLKYKKPRGSHPAHAVFGPGKGIPKVGKRFQDMQEMPDWMRRMLKGADADKIDPGFSGIGGLGKDMTPRRRKNRSAFRRTQTPGKVKTAFDKKSGRV